MNMKNLLRSLATTAVVTLAFLFGANPAQAATLTVTTLANSGAGSLRAQIAAAAPGDTIVFASNLTGSIVLTSGELGVSKSLTIEGPTANALTLSGNNSSRIFNISGSGTVVTLSSLTISNGRTSEANGAGILINSGTTVTVLNCTISGNTANAGTSPRGGGVYNAGRANLINCTLANNTARTGGGTSQGGGLYNAGTANLTNCTISGNTAFAFASGYSQGGGVLNGSGAVNVKNTIIAGNLLSGGIAEPGARCRGSVHLAGLQLDWEPRHHHRFHPWRERRSGGNRGVPGESAAGLAPEQRRPYLHVGIAQRQPGHQCGRQQRRGRYHRCPARLWPAHQRRHRGHRRL